MKKRSLWVFVLLGAFFYAPSFAGVINPIGGGTTGGGLGDTFADLLNKPMTGTLSAAGAAAKGGSGWLPAAAAFGAAAGKFIPLLPVGYALGCAIVGELGKTSALCPNNNTVGPTPPGWSGPNGPPSTSATTTRYVCGTAATAATALAACQATTSVWCASGTETCTNVRLNGTCNFGSPCSIAGTNVQQNATKTTTASPQTGCGSGYQLSGGSCVLAEGATNGYAPWPSDGVELLWPTAGTWQRNPRELDQSGLNFGGNTTVTRTGTDAVGNATSQTATAQTDGGFTITRDSQFQNSSGNSAVQRDSTTVNSSGSVTNTSSVTYNNTSIQNVNTNQIDTTGLATEATQQANNGQLTSINGKLDTTNQRLLDIKDKLTDTGTPFPGIPNADSFATSWQKVTDAWGTKYVAPSVTIGQGSCPLGAGSLPLIGSVTIPYDMTPLCSIGDSVSSVIGPAMIAIWSIIGVIIVLRA